MPECLEIGSRGESDFAAGLLAREELPWPLQKRYVHGQIAQLGDSALNLTLEETRDYVEALFALLSALPRFPIDHDVERRAGDAQHQLTRVGHHRLPPVDLLVAALADRHRLGVLHYDHDYDLIAERTDLEYESVWVAPRGSV